MSNPSAAPRTLNPGAMAVEACRNAQLAPDAREVLTPELTVRQYVDLLLERKLFADAIAALATWLPSRVSVWWACAGIRQISRDEDLAVSRSALTAAERWSRDPSEANRRAAGDVAKEANYESPGACAALGAFLSGGSLAPPNLETAVLPPEGATARAIAGAVKLAAVSKEPAKAEERFRFFSALAFDIAERGPRWDQPPAPGGPGRG